MAELHLNAQGFCVMFHSCIREKAVLLRLYRDTIKHFLLNTFPMFLPIWEAEPEGTLEAAGHMEENRKDSVTVNSLLSVRKKEFCCPKKRFLVRC